MSGPFPNAADLWRRWVLLAAAHAAVGSDACGMDSARGLFWRTSAGWTRMRAVAGGRAVVWGSRRGAPSLDRDDLMDLVPDWAVDDRDARLLAAEDTAFVLWFRRGQWGQVAQRPPLPAALGDDEALASAWADLHPGIPRDNIAEVLSRPSPEAARAAVNGEHSEVAARVIEIGLEHVGDRLSTSASEHLRDQMHAQMKSAVELGDRGNAARPSLLRHWASVNLRGTPFRFAIHLSDHALHASSTNAGLNPSEQRSLSNVLVEIRDAEHDLAQGAWLFARVQAKGRSIQLERAYDHWPSWYLPAGADGMPRPDALAREMARRSPNWVPSWGALLPRR